MNILASCYLTFGFQVMPSLQAAGKWPMGLADWVVIGVLSQSVEVDHKTASPSLLFPVSAT
jgi:hypothetical protein